MVACRWEPGAQGQSGTAVVTEVLGLDPAAAIYQSCDLIQDMSHR